MASSFFLLSLNAFSFVFSTTHHTPTLHLFHPAHLERIPTPTNKLHEVQPQWFLPQWQNTIPIEHTNSFGCVIPPHNPHDAPHCVTTMLDSLQLDLLLYPPFPLACAVLYVQISSRGMFAFSSFVSNTFPHGLSFF